MIRTLSPRALLLALAFAAPLVSAQMMPPPANVVSLQSSATVEVVKDWLTVVFSTTREGADAPGVQSQLKQALDLALAEARKIARPDQVEVHTGAFSLSPRYAPPGSKGQPPGIIGWQGSAELVVEGRDTQAIAQLTSRITALTIARVGFSLSREARQQVEGQASEQAIDRFRSHADAVTRRFGFAGYSLREVAINTDLGGGVPLPMMRMQTMRGAAEDAALPVEAGKAAVTATVSGSVQMR